MSKPGITPAQIPHRPGRLAERLAVLLAALFLAACAERPLVSITVGNSPPPPDNSPIGAQKK